MLDAIRNMIHRRQPFQVELVGLRSRRHYERSTLLFADREDGERWVREQNRTAHPLTRWELVDR